MSLRPLKNILLRCFSCQREESNLTIPRLPVLSLICMLVLYDNDKPGMTGTQLSDILKEYGIESKVNRSIDSLQSLGFLLKSVYPFDNRLIFLEKTKQGESYLSRLYRASLSDFL